MTRSDSQYGCCERMRRSIDEQFDHGAPDQPDATLADHLSQCKGCSQYQQGLKALEEQMRSLPAIPFPNEALEALLAETVDTACTSMRRRSWRLWGRPLAAAAVVALCVTISWPAWQLHLAAEQKRVDQAVMQTRYVLGVTVGVVQRVEALAVDEIYGERLFGALERFNVDWSSKPFRYFRFGD